MLKKLTTYTSGILDDNEKIIAISDSDEYLQSLIPKDFIETKSGEFCSVGAERYYTSTSIDESCNGIDFTVYYIKDTNIKINLITQ